jgi:hypothetical protein
MEAQTIKLTIKSYLNLGNKKNDKTLLGTLNMSTYCVKGYDKWRLMWLLFSSCCVIFLMVPMFNLIHVKFLRLNYYHEGHYETSRLWPSCTLKQVLITSPLVLGVQYYVSTLKFDLQRTFPLQNPNPFSNEEIYEKNVKSSLWNDQKK